MGSPGIRSQAPVPRTPVLGYVRAEDPAVAELLREALEDYAGDAGLLVADVCTEPPDAPDAPDAARPGFTRCLETVSHGTARGILVPTWAHLGPDEVPGAVLLRAARDAGALLYVADQSFTPWWAVGQAAGAPPVHADQRSATPGPAQYGELR